MSYVTKVIENMIQWFFYLVYNGLFEGDFDKFLNEKFFPYIKTY